jgi:acyl-coenzyme A synthetase/AMP-(fatty) acid ligase
MTIEIQTFDVMTHDEVTDRYDVIENYENLDEALAHAKRAKAMVVVSDAEGEILGDFRDEPMTRKE